MREDQRSGDKHRVRRRLRRVFPGLRGGRRPAAESAAESRPCPPPNLQAPRRRRAATPPTSNEQPARRPRPDNGPGRLRPETRCASETRAQPRPAPPEDGGDSEPRTEERGPPVHLNSDQEAAVTHRDRPLLILAGPGAGKTRTLCERIRRVRQNDPAGRVLAVTFTRKAAGEMRSRLDAEDRRTSVMTFHSFGVRFLRHEHEAAGLSRGFAVWDEDARIRGLKDALERRKIKTKRIELRDTIQRFSYWKNQGLRPNDVPEWIGEWKTRKLQDVRRALEEYTYYEQHRTRVGACDFDDILLYTVQALRDNNDVRRKWAAAFTHVLIDEYQDTNRPQRDIVYLLAGDNPNLCVVGDPDQSIYGWRGAEHRNIDEFAEEYGAQTIELHDNYRSGSLLVETARAMMEEAPDATRRGLRSARTTPGRITIERPQDPYDEARGIATAAKADLRNGSSTGVLYRTNALSRPVERMLVQYRVPYKVIGGFPFHERREIKACLAWLTLMDDPHDDPAWRRLAEHETHGVGGTSIAEVLAGGEQYAPPLDDDDYRPSEEGNSSDNGRGPDGPGEPAAEPESEEIETWSIGPDTDMKGVTAPAAAGPTNQALDLARGSDDEHDPDAPRIGTLRRSAADAIAEKRIKGRAAKALAELEKTIRKLSAWARGEPQPSLRLSHAISETALHDHMRNNDEPDRAAERIENVNALLEAAQEYERVTDRLDTRAFIDDVILEVADPGRNDSGLVLLMTMHASKGLEFDSVYIAHCVEGITPHEQARTSRERAEEQRLFYVAITRARNHLTLSAPHTRAGRKDALLSRYVTTMAAAAAIVNGEPENAAE